MLPEGVGIIKRSVSRNLRVARKPLRQRIFGFFTRIPVFSIGNIAVKSRGKRCNHRTERRGINLGIGLRIVISHHEFRRQTLQERKIILKRNIRLKIERIAFCITRLLGRSERTYGSARSIGRNRQPVIIFGHVRMRTHSLLRDIVPIGGIARKSGTIAALHTTGQIHGHRPVLGNLGFDIRTDINTVEREILHIALLIEVTDRSKVLDSLVAARHIEVVRLVVPRTESLFIPVRIAPAVARIAVEHHVDLALRENRRVSVHFTGFVIPIGIPRTVEHFEHYGILAQTESAGVGDLGRSGLAPFGRHDNDSRGIHTVNRSRRCVLEHRNAFDIIGINLAEIAGYTVHNVLCAAASHQNAGAVAAGLSRLLQGHHAGDTPAQHIRHISHRRLEQFLAVDLRNGARNARAFHRTVTDDNDFIDSGRVFLERNINGGNSPPPTVFRSDTIPKY